MHEQDVVAFLGAGRELGVEVIDQRGVTGGALGIGCRPPERGHSLCPAHRLAESTLGWFARSGGFSGYRIGPLGKGGFVPSVGIFDDRQIRFDEFARAAS